VETSCTPLPKKKHKNSLQVSRSPAHLPMYCKITFENIWLGARISIHFILKTKQRENVNKYACRLLSDSKPLGNNGDQLWMYTCKIDRESSLGPWGNNGGLLPYQ